MTRSARLARRLGLAVAIGVPLAIALAPEGKLGCPAPYLTELRPEGRWSLTICGQPRLFAMPGGGSDAPGWIVLRDEHGAVRGVFALAMLQRYGAMGGATEWTATSVSRSMVFDLPIDPAFGRPDPKGDDFLSVRDGPDPKRRELDRLGAGARVAICDERGAWLGIVYPAPGTHTDCGVASPQDARSPYLGPCRLGWVHGRFVDVVAG